MLRNRSLNLAVFMHREKDKAGRRETVVAVVQVPSVLPRITEVPLPPRGNVEVTASPPARRASYMLLEDLITMHAGELFPGFRVLGCSAVPRDAQLRPRRSTRTRPTTCSRRSRKSCGGASAAARSGWRSPTTRPIEVVVFLRPALRLENDDVYLFDGPLHLADLAPSAARDELREFRDEPFSPQIVPPLQEYDDIFRVIGQRDILLHHPYESFEDVVEFIERGGRRSERAGHQADAVPDQRRLADHPRADPRRRERQAGDRRRRAEGPPRRGDQHPVGAHAGGAGVHVVYGLVGLKTHCKVALVVRREGNAHPALRPPVDGQLQPDDRAASTPTCPTSPARDAYADDAGALFNLLTGYSSPPSWKRFAIAPHGLQDRIIALIEREAALGSRGRIIAKMNALVDAPVIKALYRASQAGVKIDLIVRGICCLRPGVPGVSDNIRVISIVDRFLEHARIFYFGNGGKREVYLSSADWMPRNFQRRIEVMFPIEDEGLRDRVIDEILAHRAQGQREGAAADVRRPVRPPARPRRPPTAQPAEASVRSQYRFMELAREKAQAGSAAARHRRHVSRASDAAGAHGYAAGGRPPLRRRRPPPATSS